MRVSCWPVAMHACCMQDAESCIMMMVSLVTMMQQNAHDKNDMSDDAHGGIGIDTIDHHIRREIDALK